MYTVLKSLPGAVLEAAVEIAQDKMNKGFEYAKRKALEVSEAVKESVRSGLSETLKELPGTVREISGKVAGNAKNTIKSSWEWIKKEVEGRGK